MKSIELGTKGYAETIVKLSDTAAACGPDLPEVFSTPKLVELLESAGINAMAPYYDEGEMSVGALVEIYHTGATPIGQKVTVEAELVEVKGRIFTFKITAHDERGEIGHGTHKRAVIDHEKFMKALA